MTPSRATQIMIALIAAIILFHVCILLKFIPYDITWGGRLENDRQMYTFELTSIAVNGLLMVVLLIKSGFLKWRISPRGLNVVLWVFLVLFALNTIGNLLAKTMFEKGFAVLTLTFSILLWIILKPRK